MQSQDSSNIRLGQTNVDYYIALAREMRAEWFAHQLRQFRARLADLLCKSLFGCGGSIPSH